ncbi:MAG: ABC transporter ATP-binding protein [Nitrospira sp.]|nr:ABC transporter ATP-binding protein [Nitrospira sp.]
MADLSIDMRALVKCHGATLAVDHVSLQITRGEFFSLLGPSGAGKTSLLRMLAGFETPDAGDILIDGRSMAGVPPNRRPVNLVFQSYALFPHMTVAENVAFGLEMQRLPRGEIAKRVGATLDLVQLQDKRDRVPDRLSGGEQQRVALARALVNRPAVVLLDEPLAALDQQLRQQMQAELKTIQAQVGLTFVCVTHHQEEALALSDRLAVMQQGRVMQVGRPEDLYEHPENLFVARFVGVSNEVSGTLVDVQAGEGTLLPSDVSVSRGIRVSVPAGLQSGAQAVMTVRPERVRIAPGHVADAGLNCLHGVVETMQYIGSEWQGAVRIGPSVRWTIRASNAASGSRPVAIGAPVSLQWNASDGVVLPVI